MVTDEPTAAPTQDTSSEQQQQHQQQPTPVLARAEAMSERVLLSNGDDADGDRPSTWFQHIMKYRFRYLACSIVLAFAIYFALPPLPDENNAGGSASISKDNKITDEYIINQNREIFNEMIVPSLSITSSEAMANKDTSSPQYQALEWIVSNYDDFSTTGDHRIRQRYALVTLFYATGGDDRRSIDVWNISPTIHECEWYSFANSRRLDACTDGDVMNALDLGGVGLAGTLPDEINLLTDLGKIALVLVDVNFFAIHLLIECRFFLVSKIVDQ